jgi:hypothetical protein
MSAKNPGNNIQTRLEYKYQGCQLSLSAKNGRTGPVLRIVNKNIIYLCLESLRYTYLVAKKKRLSIILQLERCDHTGHHG